jgi:hypothetical protein
MAPLAKITCVSDPMVHEGELTRLWSGSVHQSRLDSGGRRWLLAGHQRAGFGDSSRLLRHLCCLQCKRCVSEHAGTTLTRSSCASSKDVRPQHGLKKSMQDLGRGRCIWSWSSPLIARAPPRTSLSSALMLVNCCWAAAACVLTVSRSESSSARNALMAASLDGACPSAPLPAGSPLDVAPGSPLRREAGSSAAGSCWWSAKAGARLHWRRELGAHPGCRLAGQLGAADPAPSCGWCGTVVKWRPGHLAAGTVTMQAAARWAAWAANPMREIIRKQIKGAAESGCQCEHCAELLSTCQLDPGLSAIASYSKQHAA